jgi:hypothetical protein
MNALLVSLLVLSFGNLTLAAEAEESKEPVQMRNLALKDVLELYARHHGQPVFVSPTVAGNLRVDIESQGAISRAEADALISKTLLGRYQIQIRTADTGEILVESVKPRKPLKEGRRRDEATAGNYQFRFPGTHSMDVLEYYERITGKPVFAALDLIPKVSFEGFGYSSREEMTEAIRKQLAEKYGVEMKETRTGEVLVFQSEIRKEQIDEKPSIPMPRVRVRAIRNR